MPERSYWSDEIAYFDSVAETCQIVPLDTRIVERYANPSGIRSIDFMFRVAGDLKGKRVLDVGAGTGEDSLVLAALGARVTALDISPASLRVLEARARISKLSDRIHTMASPVEVFTPPSQFDLIWVHAFLHHVLPDLPRVLDTIVRSLAPGGRIVVSEPTAPRWLRRIRLRLPIPADGTPGERPLEPRELAMIAKAFARVKVRYFHGLSRLERVLPSRSSQVLARADAVLLQLPVIKRLGGVAVMWN
jgi:2-polyprenyl-3-methyl-5-hydroxy-6-metoxy-1,4-benzoquinol methylase